MFGMEKLFGYNKEAGSASPEASKATGREAMGVSDDISTPEAMERGDRHMRIKEGIKHIVAEENIPHEDMLGRQEFFAEHLKANGVLTEEDLHFHGMMDEISAIAREVAREGIEKRTEKSEMRKEAHNTDFTDVGKGEAEKAS